MQSDPGSITVRPADLGGSDGAAVSRLVEAYLRQTELEKTTHLGSTGDDVEGYGDDLPERYRSEVDDPQRAYANAVVHLAERDGTPVGVVVVQQNPDSFEIKRVWVDPSARGRRVGSALLDAALRGHELPVRLTVWDWREGAVQLYRTRGFSPVASWDDRPRLLCLERPRVSAAAD